MKMKDVSRILLTRLNDKDITVPDDKKRLDMVNLLWLEQNLPIDNPPSKKLDSILDLINLLKGLMVIKYEDRT